MGVLVISVYFFFKPYSLSDSNNYSYHSYPGQIRPQVERIVSKTSEIELEALGFQIKTKNPFYEVRNVIDEAEAFVPPNVHYTILIVR